MPAVLGPGWMSWTPRFACKKQAHTAKTGRNAMFRIISVDFSGWYAERTCSIVWIHDNTSFWTSDKCSPSPTRVWRALSTRVSNCAYA